MTNTASPAELLAHLGALRQLARHLLRDEAAAEDAVQDTYVQALRTPPRSGATTGAWMKQVLRRVVAKGWRSQARRQARERHHARPEGAPDPGDARLVWMATLLRALQALPLPQREALERRYLDEQPPREIARRLGIPVGTVKTRLRRGLASLRVHLAHEEGEDWRGRLAVGMGLGTSLGSAAAGTAAGGVLMSTFTKTSGALVLIALLAVGLWWQEPDVPARAGTQETDGSRRALTGTLAHDETRPTLDGRHASGDVAPARSAGTADAIPAIPDDDAHSTTVKGEAWITDMQGRRQRVAEGILKVSWWGREHEDGLAQDVPIRQGRWQANEPQAQELSLDSLIVDGTPVAFAWDNPVSLPADGPLTIEARSYPAKSLRVVDAETGRDLDAFYLLRSSRDYGPEHPGQEYDPSTRHEEMPLRVPVERDDLDHDCVARYVGAPGHAWRFVSIRLEHEGEVRVALPRGVTLDVALEGAPLRGVPAMLVVDRVAPEPHTSVLWKGVSVPTSVSLAGVSPGRYQIRLRQGNSPIRGRILGKASVTVTDGEPATVRLPYAHVARPPLAPLSGRIHVSAGWPMDRFSLLVEPAGGHIHGPAHVHLAPDRGLVAVANEPRTWQFRIPRLQAGPIRIRTHGIPFAWDKHLKKEGQEPLDLRVPPPRTIRLRPTGSHQTSSTWLRLLRWRRDLPGSRGFDVQGSASRAGPDEDILISVPEGMAIRIFSADPKPFMVADTRIPADAPTDPTPIPMAIQRMAQLRVHFMDGDQRIRPSVDHPFQIRCDGREVTLWQVTATEEDVFEIWAAATGACQLHLGDMPGFRAVGSHDVMLDPDLPADLVIRLMREEG